MVAPAAFAAVFDRLDGLPLPVAARELARAGVAVFPCVPGEKTPIVASGFRRATTDPHQVAHRCLPMGGAHHVAAHREVVERLRAHLRWAGTEAAVDGQEVNRDLCLHAPSLGPRRRSDPRPRRG